MTPTTIPVSDKLDKEVAEKTAELERLSNEARELTDGTSTDLVPTGRTAQVAKREMARMRSQALRKEKEIEKASLALQKLIDEQQEMIRRRIDGLMEVMRPMQEMVKRMEEGIWTVNLYLGRDEQIVVLKQGSPAPADTPITIRQMVLAMDQECAAAATEGGIDALSIEQFDEWLQADEAHLDQVLPEPKGIVALQPRFDAKEYGDSRRTAEVDELNKQTYFLIRNGEQVFRHCTDFKVGRNLVPKSDEFTSYFWDEKRNWDTREMERFPLEPGTDAWMKAQDKADAQQRHYMRVALILQGLLDRTTVFHPLPPEGVSFTQTIHHEEGRVKFIMDAEAALATGREKFSDWLERLNAQLRPGMRIVGNFEGYSEGFGALTNRSEYGTGYGHSRLYPATAARPKSNVIHYLDMRKPDGGLVFRYDRTDEIWDPYEGYKKPERRASCTIHIDDDFIVPFDLVTVDEMKTYLNARLDRHEYVRMFPVLHAAIAAKEDEVEQEAPFRTMLAGVLARENRVTVAEAMEDATDLVAWWKLANRFHRPLVSGDERETKAVNAIVKEHKRRLKDRKRTKDPVIVQTLRAKHPSALVIARQRNGRYLVLEAEHPTINVFVKQWEYTAKGLERSSTRWKFVGNRHTRWTILHHIERWDEWDFGAHAGTHLTGPEVDQAMTIIHRSHTKLAAIGYRTERSGDHFEAHYIDKPTVVPEKHLLTRHATEIEVASQNWKWRRGQGGKLIVERKGYRHHWSTPVWGDSQYHSNHHILWRDDKLIAHVDAERKRYRVASKETARLRDIAWAYNASVEEAWVKRAEAAEYSRFLEDYDDPELWEGHRKMLHIEYPHSERRWDRDNEKGLWFLIARLVEDGVDLNGMKVSQALEEGKGHGVTIELPEDILDLTLSRKEDEPEEEDDDDEDYFELEDDLDV